MIKHNFEMDSEYVRVFILFMSLTYVFTECPVGYHGYNCSEPCRSLSYGLLCQHQCNCTAELCNPITGCSQQSEDCLNGYYGNDCFSPCRYPNYGHKCQSQCNCNIANCNHKIGCKTDNTTKRNDSTDFLQKYPVIFIIGGSVLLIFIVIVLSSVCIKLIRKCRLNKKREREGNFDSEFSSFSYHDDANARDPPVRYCDNMEVRNNHKFDIYENTVF